MVTCYKCIFGQPCQLYDNIANESYDMVYCNATEEYITENNATKNLPCDLYVEELDDNETKESSA